MAMIASAVALGGGLVITGWSLKTSAREDAPGWLRWTAAVLAPVGVLVALAGAAGVAVPGFYGS